MSLFIFLGEGFCRDIPVRSLGALRLVNPWGEIRVSGWSQSRIRVPDCEDAERFQIQSKELSNGVLEVGAFFGPKMVLKDRISERTKAHQTLAYRCDLVLKAPVGMKLEISSKDGKVGIQDWKGDLKIRKSSGLIEGRNVEGRNSEVSCPNCTIDFKKVTGEFHIESGAGLVLFEDMEGPSLFVQSREGTISLNQVKANLNLVTESGAIKLKNTKGQLDFRSDQGAVEINGLLGAASGFTRSGDIRIEAVEWKPKQKGFLETETGNVQLTIPKNASFDLEIKTIEKPPFVDFHLETKSKTNDGYRYSGRVGFGGQLLRIQSEAGSVAVVKGSWGQL